MGKLLSSLLFLFFVSCAAKTGLDYFPKSSDEIDFDRLDPAILRHEQATWSTTVDYEYAFAIAGKEEPEICGGILAALQNEGYAVVVNDHGNRVIMAMRGAQLNDVHAIAGVYLKKTSTAFRIYVKMEIVQDIPGTWKENRAEELSMSICNRLHCSPQ